MDHAGFTEICLHQLKMSGVHEGERLVVLTQEASGWNMLMPLWLQASA